ncbi:MAG: hypothetical protein IJV77_01025, partial [Clostridia bacterium]|nr:hypothetical protein [Clostridia bacterium]
LSGNIDVTGAENATIAVSTTNFVYALTENLDASENKYTVAITLGGNDNYEINSLTGTSIEITARPVDVVVTGSKQYDGNTYFDNGEFTVEFNSVADNALSGLLNDGDANITASQLVAGGKLAGATYELVTSLALTNSNYVINNVTSALAVTKATVKVSFVQDQEVIYGTTPNLVPTYEGFVAGDEHDAPVFTYKLGENVYNNQILGVDGAYTITATVADLDNYTFDVQNNVTFTVVASTISVGKKSATSSDYGKDIATPVAGSFDIQVTDNLTAEQKTALVDEVKGLLSFTAVDGQTILTKGYGAGTYDVKVVINSDNFKFAGGKEFVVADAYVINKISLTVAGTATSTFGSSVLSGDTAYTVTGWAETETQDSKNSIYAAIGQNIQFVPGNIAGLSVAGSPYNNGEVTLTEKSAFNFANYTVQITTNVALTVQKKSVTINLAGADYSKGYNSEPTREISVATGEGFDITATVALGSANVDTYAISTGMVSSVAFKDAGSAETYSLGNYDFAFTGNMQIVAHAIEVVHNATVDYSGNK